MKSSFFLNVTGAALLLFAGLITLYAQKAGPAKDTRQHSALRPELFRASQPSDSLAQGQVALSAPTTSIQTNSSSTPQIGALLTTSQNGSVGQSASVLFTVTIPHTSPLPLAINLVRSRPGSLEIAVGTLRDDGLMGDAVAADREYSLRLNVLEMEPVELSYRASAAFQGQLLRVKTPPVIFRIWSIVNLVSFGIQFSLPPGLVISISDPIDVATFSAYGDVQAASGGIQLLKRANPGILSPSQWADLNGYTAPPYLTRSSPFICGGEAARLDDSLDSFGDTALIIAAKGNILVLLVALEPSLRDHFLSKVSCP